MVYWQPFEFDWRVYELQHLHPLEFPVKQPAAKDNPEIIYHYRAEFIVTCDIFSCHASEGWHPEALDSRFRGNDETGNN